MSDQPISSNNKRNATDGEVGYKHPPVKSQFRKGQSGNPRGRRKGQRNLAPVLREVLRQTVKVKRGGKTERMSKGEALIQMLLSKAHSGDARAIEAVLVLTEKIARIDTPQPKLAGPGNYEFMVVPGVAGSVEEWQRELNMRHETAEIREMVAAAAAAGKFLTAGQRAGLRKAVDAALAAGTTVTASQLATLREWLGLARASEAALTVTPRKVTRPLNRIDKRPNKLEQQTNSETAAPAQTAAAQTPADEIAPPSVSTIPRPVTRRPLNRIDKGFVKSNTAEPSSSETATAAQTPADETAPPSVSTIP
jgi:hypothetical protein